VTALASIPTPHGRLLLEPADDAVALSAPSSDLSSIISGRTVERMPHGDSRRQSRPSASDVRIHGSLLRRSAVRLPARDAQRHRRRDTQSRRHHQLPSSRRSRTKDKSSSIRSILPISTIRPLEADSSQASSGRKWAWTDARDIASGSRKLPMTQSAKGVQGTDGARRHRFVREIWPGATRRVADRHTLASAPTEREPCGIY
jgi:hypothetical protein